jgi:ribonuclease Z
MTMPVTLTVPGAPGVREHLIREMSAIYAGDPFFGEDRIEIPVGTPAPARLD